MYKKALIRMHKRALSDHHIGALELAVPVGVYVLALSPGVDAPLADVGPVRHEALAAGRHKHERQAVADHGEKIQNVEAGVRVCNGPVAVGEVDDHADEAAPVEKQQLGGVGDDAGLLKVDDSTREDLFLPVALDEEVPRIEVAVRDLGRDEEPHHLYELQREPLPHPELVGGKDEADGGVLHELCDEHVLPTRAPRPARAHALDVVVHTVADNFWHEIRPPQGVGGRVDGARKHHALF